MEIELKQSHDTETSAQQNTASTSQESSTLLTTYSE